MKYLLYTKGSCDNCSAYREGGYAYIIVDENDNVIKQFSIGTLYSTNNIMALKAIIEGCKAIRDKGSDVIVFSDNQYAINVLSGFWKASVNKDLVDKHKIDQRRLNIQYKWIKKGCKNKYNQTVISLVDFKTVDIREKHHIHKRESHKMFKKYYHKGKK